MQQNKKKRLPKFQISFNMFLEVYNFKYKEINILMENYNILNGLHGTWRMKEKKKKEYKFYGELQYS